MENVELFEDIDGSMNHGKGEGKLLLKKNKQFKRLSTDHICDVCITYSAPSYSAPRLEFFNNFIQVI